MLRAAAWLRGRRGALIGASTAVVCLGGILGACTGGEARDGYVAAGPAGGFPPASGTAAAPTADVTLVPLPGAKPTGGATSPAQNPAAGSSASSAPRQSAPEVPEPPVPDNSAVPPVPAKSSPGGGSSPSAAPSTSPAPAALTVSGTARRSTDQRRCEQVTVSFRNTGGSAVRSGTVAFGTHIIGGLGIDWATITSSDPLPAPIGAGASVRKTWTVCVDAWRVPLGMHIETRDVSVQWK
ncbi:hypothetical protein ABZ845_23710 [Streptomyces sp. NPDC047022]|uniref:hypothetical protein n=1 Tax=Streptomyces sp. NPDC047022 TaxID=3155737 RepID=UPI0033E94403